MTARAMLVESDGLTLTAGIVAGPDPRAAVILCHGLPGPHPRPANDQGYAGLARDVADRGYVTAWFDFRGVRTSPGDFSLEGWARDLEAVITSVGRDRAGSGLPVVLAGSSAGGAVAIAVAARRPDVAAVAALAAPATLRLMSDSPGEALARLRNLGLIRDPAFPRDVTAWWDEIDHLAAIRHVPAVAPRPLLLIHGDADDIVPYAHAERLFAAASRPKELARLPGGGHQLRHDERAVECLVDWLDRLDLPAPSA